ncbi:MAG: lipid IV(A) 3-deoxy-D-manno-octulosonic acid transferase [Gammaproteobacteria bacterium]|nr:lipid IV(A) 3-deoxy-D-manno-octulosonic acid transferase [Gammaproteobacteria bacterium]
MLLYLLFPAILANLWRRGRRSPGYRDNRAQRFGRANQQGPYDCWIHAVSVGEGQAGALLARQLWTDDPQLRILFTSTTPTGRDHLHRLLGEQLEHQYLPYDFPGAVRRFLDTTQPRVAVLMETEIWPNLLYGCARRDIPVILANARLSARSARGYRRISALVRPLFEGLMSVAAQSHDDAARLISCGVEPDRMEICGSIKFDMPTAPVSDELQATKTAWGQHRPTWIAASTHAGEEETLLAAHQTLLQRQPEALLLLAPRHPERFNSVAEQCRKANLETVLRSDGTPPSSTTQVYLVDTMGELNQIYGLCDAAFVGGSLVPTGGHNLLEPCAAGIPVLFGPHVFNFMEIAERLIAAKAGREVENQEALTATLEQLLTDHQWCQTMGQRGQRMVANNRGATTRVARLVRRWLDQPVTACPPPANR